MSQTEDGEGVGYPVIPRPRFHAADPLKEQSTIIITKETAAVELDAGLIGLNQRSFISPGGGQMDLPK